MPIVLKKQVAVLREQCSIEEAENLLQWYIEHPKGKVNAKQLTHLHTAVLQVLMAVKPSLSSWPEDDNMKALLTQILKH